MAVMVQYTVSLSTHTHAAAQHTNTHSTDAP